LAGAVGGSGCRCPGGTTDAAPPDAALADAGVPACLTFDDPAGQLEVCSDPFRFTLRGADGRPLTASAPGGALSYVALAGADVDESTGPFLDPAAPPGGLVWRTAGPAVAYDSATATFTLATDEPGRTVAVRVVSGPPGAAAGGELSLEAALSSAEDIALVRWSLAAQPGEALYGLGEWFDALDHRGRVRPMQLRVSGVSDSGTNEVHYPVPFFVSTLGYGVFAESYYPGAFDLGAADPAVYTITYAAAALPLRLYPAPAADPLAALDPYTARTGRPAVPPDWSFAPQQWRNEWADAAEMLADAMAMRALDLPGSCMWIDNPWQTAYNDFNFNTLQFPDPPGLLAALHDLGYRVIAWSTPYLDTSNDSGVRAGMNPNTGGLRETAEAMGWLVTLPNGEPWPIPWGSGRVGTPVDWTVPDAAAFWQDTMRRATDLGIEGFKLDYHEDIVVELIASRPGFEFGDGSNQNTMHRRTCNLEHETYAGTLLADYGAQFLLTRCGTFGDQAWIGAVWPGDLDNDFSTHDDVTVGGMPAAVRGGLSLAASGFPYFASDIGGYRGGMPAEEVLLRWAAYAALLPIMQLGGAGASHNPWDPAYSAAAVDTYRTYARLHMDLFPFFWTLALRANDTGRPPVAPLGLAFPGDAAARADELAFLVGEALLVAPVATAGAVSRTVYLPAGRWIDFWTGAATDGPATIDAPAPLEVLPLWQRAGTAVPLGDPALDTLADATPASGVLDPGDLAGYRGWRLAPDGGAPAATTTLPDGSSVTLAAGAAAPAGALVAVTLAPGTPGSGGPVGGPYTDVHLMIELAAAGAAGAAAAPPTAATFGGVPVPAAATAAELDTCGRCFFVDPAAPRVHVALDTHDGELRLLP
jgi:alpha-D-xyloside xylohydrolase